MIIFILLFSKYFLTIPSRYQIICQVFNGEEKSSFHPHGAWVRPEVTSKGLDRPFHSVVCWPYLQGQHLGMIQYNPSKFIMMIPISNFRAFLVVSFSMPYCPTSPYSHHVLRDTLGRSFPCLFFTFIPSFLFPELPS